MKKQKLIPVLIGLFLGTTFLNPTLKAADSASAAYKDSSPKRTSTTTTEHISDPTEHPSSSEGRKLPFRGKLASVDTSANTITVTYSTGNKVFHITHETEISRDNKPATLKSGVPGEPVSGAYIKNGDRMELTKLTLGKKEKEKDKDKETTRTSGKSTPKSKMKPGLEGDLPK